MAASETGIQWEEVIFDGNIGSVFMRLAEMDRRFDVECGPEEKTILRTMRKLYICGIYEGRQVFPLNWIKTITDKLGLKAEDYQWIGWLEKLKGWEFITIVSSNRVYAEEVYLEDVVI
ncbi:hypothetical protein ACFLVX_03655 [Chloroflexota bacterium]